MNAEAVAQLDPLAVARVPQQRRAKERFEAVLREAEIVLEEYGVPGFSIPIVAERLHMTRGSVYAYFPTPYALFNELVRRHVAALESLYRERSDELRGQTWWNGIEWAVSQAVEYHNTHPGARMLMLGGAVTESSYSALEALLKRLGQLVRAVFESHPGKRRLPPSDPDVFTLAIDMGLACFRRSYFEYGRITPAYRDEAIRAMRHYLSSHMQSER